MNKIYIIDAVNYLFRSYYAIGPMTNEKGQSTSALYGFIRSVQKLFKMFSPSYIVCVFDGPDNKKSRQEIYAEYKAHRKEAPLDLYPQIEWAAKYCALAGIPTLSIEGVEADDVMASVAVWAKKQDLQAYLCTSDKDLAQLVDATTFVLHPHKDYQLIDKEQVEAIYGVKPEQIRDFLAITGDASDNIPGLEGFGPKTAATLLKEFGTLEELLNHPEKVKGEKKQEILKTQKEIALLSQQLATVNTHIEIPHDLSFYALQKENSDLLKEFYREMHFRSLLKEEIGTEEKPKTPSSTPQYTESDSTIGICQGGAPNLSEAQPMSKQPNLNSFSDADRIKDGGKSTQTEPILESRAVYLLINTEEDLHRLLSDLSQEKEIGLDTETTSINPHMAQLVGIGFCVRPPIAWYVPCNGNIPRSKVIEMLREFFKSTKASFFGHNIKYDVHVLFHEGISFKTSFDTMIASYLINPQDRRHNLDDLARQKWEWNKIPIESLIGKGKNALSMDQVPIDQVSTYCCEDIDATARLKNLFEKEIQEKKLETVFYDIEMPLLPILAKMEQKGVYVDEEELAKIGKTLSEELDRLKKKIFDTTGEFNLNSPKQLSEILFEKLQLPKPSRSKSAFNTGSDILEELAIDHPIVRPILQFRTLEKLRTTYVESLPGEINPKTKRIHPTFNQSVAATGRLSCQDPNLQNIPIRSKEGKSIRSCFKPQNPHWSFIGADYSQIELRLLAHFSEDKGLIKAFKNKEDIHTHTAATLFNLPPTLVTPDLRAQAKTVNFGVLYGQGPFGLASQLGISMKEASHFITTYFERYPLILKYLEYCKAEARKTGMAVTLTGRQRPIPEINNKNPAIRAAAERLAVNTPLQGTAADLIKKAMIAIDAEIAKRHLKGQMILQIHDELIFEVPDEEIKIFTPLIQHHMENVFSLKVPIEIHLAIGKNWAEC